MVPVKSTFTTTRKADPITLKEELSVSHPSYTITYSVMTDSYKLQNKEFRHTIFFNTGKSSKLESISLQMKRKRLVFTLLLFLVLAILWVVNHQLNEGTNLTQLVEDKYFFLLILFFGFFQYLVDLLHPGLHKELVREHAVVMGQLAMGTEGKIIAN